MPRQTRHGSPRNVKRIRRERSEIIDPTLGVHSGEVPHELQPGHTPASQNFEVGSGYIQPRSGLSFYSDTGVGDVILSAEAFTDAQANWYGVAASRETIALFNGAAGAWSVLSADSLTEELPSSNSRIYWDMASIFVSQFSQRIVVMTNAGQIPPKYFVLEGNTATYSDFTALYSFVSRAHSVTAFDERIVFFNVHADGIDRPNRIAWSVRGNALEELILLGAGYQDVDGMIGEGLAVETQGNQLVLFTEREIWVGRARRDIFAFDFQRLPNDTLGTINERTIANTPAGLIFVGNDMEIYLLNGVQIQPIGRGQTEFSRVQQKLKDEVTDVTRMWALYNPRESRYELYYAIEGDAYATRALFFDFRRNSFFEQRFDSHELSAGHSFPKPEDLTGVTWAEAVDTWQNQDSSWNNFTAQGSALVNEQAFVYSSDASMYRFLSGQTTDDGQAIDVRWRSHAMQRKGRTGYDDLEEVWVEYGADSASSASIWYSADGGANFEAPFAFSFVSSDHSIEQLPAQINGRAPMFELRLNDGGTPRINRMDATLRDLGRWGGGF